MAHSLKKLKEVILIEKIAKSFKSKDKSVVVSIGDDAAVVKKDKGSYSLYTVDMLIEGVHFKKGEDPEKIGYKAMAVSVSDIAAMGGMPKYALVSVGLPKDSALTMAQGLFYGIKEVSRKFDIDIIGGDTNRSERLVIDVFMVGEVERKRLVLRSTAKAGDHIFVSGPLGNSLAGRHLMFEPRVKETRFLGKNFKVTSMIDLSDGLGMDLNRVTEASHLGAILFEESIPKNKGVKNTRQALYDGEDFELLFTLGPQDAFKLMSGIDKKNKFNFYHIGKMTSLFLGVKMWTKDRCFVDINCDGFKHF
jgi:thiamine-monophosphate kinase